MATAEKQVPRLQQRYRDEIAPALMEEFGYQNPMQVPRVVKVVVNMGVGEGKEDAKFVTQAAEELAQICGQRPRINKARKSISNFKLREGMPVGCSVTLRRERMWEFLDRLIALSLPRIRDFRGLSPKSFDGHGNYSMGVREQTIFPEIDPDKVSRLQGLNITIATTAKTDPEALALLRKLGVPLREN